MLTKTNLLTGLAGIALAATLNLRPATAQAQGTAFTYQGRLNNGGSPVTGRYDLTFALFNAAAGGGQLGNTLTNTATGVTNGLFLAALDFGGVFDGTGCWLEIGVRTNGTGAFTTLAERQPVTPTPYAVYAETVNAAGISGTVPGGSLGGVYGSPVTLNNTANNFTGNGSGLANVNAVTLGGQGAGNFWNIGGNSGTAASLNFLGTTDNQPLELRVNGVRAFRLEPQLNGLPNVIGGESGNAVYSGSADVVAGGNGNQVVSGTAATISGGNGNQISESYAAIAGGSFNRILPGAAAAAISGGHFNSIKDSAGESVIAGGVANTIETNSIDSTIGGGYYNLIAGYVASATIGGGSQNTIQFNASDSTIGGGQANAIQAYTDGAVIAGGYSNSILTGAYSAVVSGGIANTASGPGSFVGGGGTDGWLFNQGNTAGGTASAIVGGLGNLASGVGSFVGGGGYDGLSTLAGNTASGGASVIGGGIGNANGGNAATVGGGYNNQASIGADHATIGGGNSNRIQTNSYSSTIAGGEDNMIGTTNTYSTVAGGKANQILGGATGATIGGGELNQIQTGAAAATIGGGAGNTNTGTYATIPGGVLNVAASYAFAAGTRAKAVNPGAFVWADAQNADFASTADNQFAVRAGGGVRLDLGAGNLEIASGGLKVTGAGVGTATPVFIQVASAANIADNWTVISNPLCDGNPNAILIVTPNFSPGGGGFVYNNHPIGVWYANPHWAIFNQDIAAMPVGAAFNVLVVKP